MTTMNEIIDKLKTEGCSCVVAKDGVVRCFTRGGVADLFDLYRQQSEFLYGSQVADKVVGRAAAALIVLGGVGQVYATTISSGAVEFLRAAGVEFSYGELVPHIVNRTATDMCPLESVCSQAQTAVDIYAATERFILAMRQNSVR